MAVLIGVFVWEILTTLHMEYFDLAETQIIRDCSLSHLTLLDLGHL